jgi:hypothetical protein
MFTVPDLLFSHREPEQVDVEISRQALKPHGYALRRVLF